MSEQLTMDAPSTALAVIPASAVSTIIAADPDNILGKLAAKVAAHKPDISTPKGRKEIRSLADEIATTKMDLIRLGKGLREDWVKKNKAVLAEEKIIEERMDALKVQVRAPLTAWENREKDRVAGHEAALAEIVGAGAGTAQGWETLSVEQMRERLSELTADVRRDWEEFGNRAADAMAVATDQITNAIRRRQRADDEAAELAKLRAEAEERARQDAIKTQQERERRIAEEAAARARQDATEQAERGRQETLRAAAEERARVEREAAEERQRAEDARLAIVREREVAEARAAKAEQDRIDAEARAEVAQRQAEADRVEAARRAAEASQRAAEAAEAARIAAAEQAERDKAAAVVAEQRRVAAVREAEEAEARRRAENKAHKAKVNNTAVAALMADPGLSLETAKAVVVAIAGGKVPSVRIEY